MDTARLRIITMVFLAATLSACAAPVTQTTAAPAQQTQPAAPKPPPRMSRPLPPEQLPAPVAIDRSCRTNADCAIKDVGSCCGAMPACVNKDSPADPAAVQAQCAKRGMKSVCGFAQITACTCRSGQCMDEREPVGGWIENETPPPGPVR